MTDPMKHTAQLLAKGMDKTGWTESHTRTALGRAKGGHYLMVVEAAYAGFTEDEDGNQQLKLKPVSVEPVPVEQEKAVREFVRAIARQRRVDDGQLALTDEAVGSEDAVTNATAALAASVPDWDGDPDSPVEPAADPEPEAEPSNVAQFSGKAK